MELIKIENFVNLITFKISKFFSEDLSEEIVENLLEEALKDEIFWQVLGDWVREEPNIEEVVKSWTLGRASYLTDKILNLVREIDLF